MFLSTVIFNFAFLLFTLNAFALDINRRVLPNGLTLLHVERHNLPMVVVNLLVKAGQISEPKEGLASLTASLLDEGTKTRTSVQISEEIEFIGGSLGSSASNDTSGVSLSVLKKDIEKGFDLFSDILLNPSFPAEEIQRRKDLTKGSLRRSEEDPGFVAGKAFKKAVFGEHPYGRLVSGSPEAIDKINREDIVGFYTDYYVPNNAILTVVGDLTPKELDDILARYLKGWTKRAVAKKKTQTPPPHARKTIKVDKDLTQATILIGHTGISRGNPDFYAVNIMNYILGGGGFSSRLMVTIRDDMGLAYDVHSVFAPNKEPGYFQVSVQTKNESANKAMEEILRQIRLIRESGVTEQELNDAKTYLIGSFPRRIDTMGKIAGFLSSMEFFELGLDYIDKYPKLINSVTNEDIKRVAKKYLDPENYTLVIVAKQSEAKAAEAGIKD